MIRLLVGLIRFSGQIKNQLVYMDLIGFGVHLN